MSTEQPPTTEVQKQNQTADQPKSLEEIQLTALCNWCRNPLVMDGDTFSESNFKDAGLKWHSDDTTNAQAVYCTDCLNDDTRTSRPKIAIDRTTLQEVLISEIQASQ